MHSRSRGNEFIPAGSGSFSALVIYIYNSSSSSFGHPHKKEEDGSDSVEQDKRLASHTAASAHLLCEDEREEKHLNACCLGDQ
jgi:hypothetical protein